MRKVKENIFTIGHSTRSLKEFHELLKIHGVKQVIDIRTIPRSRHNPQFNRETFSIFLRNHRIGYRHMKALGGLRHALANSPNTGWRNTSFRGFADYMQTDTFRDPLDKLIQLARKKPVAIMCAEAVPWQCHRSLVGDTLVVRGIKVLNIMTKTNVSQHTLTPFAKVSGTTITYPPEKKISP